MPTIFPGDYRPQNYDGRFRGKVTVRRALSNSLNIPAVKVLEQVGIEDAVHYAKRLGLEGLGQPSEYGLSLVLGGAAVTPLEMTTGYATMANQGIYNKAYAINKIIDKYNNTIYAAPTSATAVGEEECT